MPKCVCPKCGKEWYGWALVWGDKSYCTCGQLLPHNIRNDKKTVTIGEITGLGRFIGGG